MFEGEIPADKFLDYVGHSLQAAETIIKNRKPVYPLVEVEGITAFVKEFYTEGYDKILRTVSISIIDKF